MNLTTTSGTIRLFISYSHENKVWFSRLRPILKFPRVSNVGQWHDQVLQAGDHWDEQIRDELQRMDIFVCLVSYEFLASDYIMDVEVKKALTRETKGEIVIVPVLLYPVNLKEDCEQLHTFNPLPCWGRCWRDFEQNNGHYQDAHKHIRDGLREAIAKARGKRKSSQPR